MGDDGRVRVDLKFHVFNKKSGTQTIYIAVISDRFGEHPRGDMYDADWNIQDISIGNYERSAAPVPRPKSLDALLAIARALASEFESLFRRRVEPDAWDNRLEPSFAHITYTRAANRNSFHQPSPSDPQCAQSLALTIAAD